MTKYLVSVTRTLAIEAQTLKEATTMSLYATYYPEYLNGIENLYCDVKVLSNENQSISNFSNWPENKSNTD